jgi:hypothetical protein
MRILHGVYIYVYTVEYAYQYGFQYQCAAVVLALVHGQLCLGEQQLYMRISVAVSINM